MCETYLIPVLKEWVKGKRFTLTLFRLFLLFYSSCFLSYTLSERGKGKGNGMEREWDGGQMVRKGKEGGGLEGKRVNFKKHRRNRIY